MQTKRGTAGDFVTMVVLLVAVVHLCGGSAHATIPCYATGTGTTSACPGTSVTGAIGLHCPADAECTPSSGSDPFTITAPGEHCKTWPGVSCQGDCPGSGDVTGCFTVTSSDSSECPPPPLCLPCIFGCPIKGLLDAPDMCGCCCDVYADCGAPLPPGPVELYPDSPSNRPQIYECSLIGVASSNGGCNLEPTSGQTITAEWQIGSEFNKEATCPQTAVMGDVWWCCGKGRCNQDYGTYGMKTQFLSKDCKGDVLLTNEQNAEHCPEYIKVRVEFFGPPHPTCEDDGCCTCSTGQCSKPNQCPNGLCTLGTSRGGVEGLDYDLSLGRTAYGQQGASLAIYAQRAQSGLATPKALRVRRELPGMVTRENGSLKSYPHDAQTTSPCIVTAQGDVTILVWNDRKYEMILRDTTYQPFKKVTVESFDDVTPNDTLHITETTITPTSESPAAVYQFKWTDEGSGVSSWTLQEGTDADTILRTTTRSEGAIAADGSHVARTTVQDGNGTIVSDVEQALQAFQFGDKVMSEVVHLDEAGQANLISTWEYYNDPGDVANYGWMKSHKTSSGYWEFFDYTSTGPAPHTKTTVSQLGDNPALLGFDANDTSNVVTTVDTYLDLLVSGRMANLVRKTTIKLAGQPKETRYYVRWAPTQDGFYEKWNVVCADPADATSPATLLNGLWSNPGTNLIERTCLYGSTNEALAAKPRWILATTGMLTRYTYVVDAQGSFTGETWEDYGTADTATMQVQDGLRTITVVNAAGGEVSRTVKRIVGGVAGANSTMSQSVASTVDGLLRPNAVTHAFGTGGSTGYVSNQQYDCCGLASSTDRAGRTTTYEHDALKWLISQTEYPAGSTTGVTTSYDVDPLGRVLNIYRDGGAVPIEQNTYDRAGRLTKHVDEYGRYTFYTYRQITRIANHILSETRVYPHDPSSGPVQVTWANAQGTVRRWTGAGASGAWSHTSPPVGTEVLTQLSREDMTLDYAGRVLITHRYHDLTDYDQSADGIKYTSPTLPSNYYETINEYDALGQLRVRTDEMGNETETHYTNGRPDERKQGVGASRATVSTISYTGDDVAQVTHPRPIAALSLIATNYRQDYLENTRESWTMPVAAPAPWTVQISNYQGQLIEQSTYAHSGTTLGNLLARTTYVYEDANRPQYNGKGFLLATRQYAVNNGTAGSYRQTTYEYDAAGRKIIVKTPEGGFSWVKYDGYGRVERTTQAAVGGDTADPSDDVVVGETEYSYDTSYAGCNRVIGTMTYERLHDAQANGVGLLSQHTGWARITYQVTSYDSQGRIASTVDYGDDPMEEPIVTTYEYPSSPAETWRQTTDNAGHKTRTYYDILGRTTKLIENYQGNGEPPTTLTPDYNRKTEYLYYANSAIYQQIAYLTTQTTQTTTYTQGSGSAAVASNSQLTSIQYPPGSCTTGTNTVSMTYNADGSLATRTDQRGVVLTFAYDDAARRTSQQVTGGSVPAGSDRGISYTFTDLGLPNTITSSDGTNSTSGITYAYNSFGQVESETLDLGGAGSLAAKTIGYGYSDGSSGVSRLESLTYPSGRQISYSYAYDTTNAGYYPGQSAIDGAFNRVAEIRQGSTALAAYAYTGLNRPVARWTNSPNVALTYDYDSFGRLSQVRHAEFTLWPTQMYGTTYAGSTYGYDAAGNRVYDQPLLMPAHSQFYEYDGLNRLTKATRGVLLDTDHPGLTATPPYASPRTIDPTYDLLGNFLQDNVNSHVEARTHSSANEITSRSVSSNQGGVVDPGPAVYLHETFATTSFLDNWESIVGGFASGSGFVSSASLADDPAVPWPAPKQKALMLARGLTNLTDIAISADVTFPAANTYAGLIFGYQSSTDYWVYLIKCVTGAGDEATIYHVTSAGWTAMAGPVSASVDPNTSATLGLAVQGRYVYATLNGLKVADCSVSALPPGRLGVLAGQTGINFDDIQVVRIDWPAPATPTWQVYDGQIAVVTGTNTLQLSMRDNRPFALAVREGFWASDCGLDATLTTGQQGGIAFLVQDKNNYCFIAPASDSSMNLWIVSNGVPTTVSATVPGNAVNWTQSHRWLIRVSGTNLDLAVQADGTWREVFSSEDNGLDVLTSAPDSGAIGLATSNIAGNAIACSSFGYGYASDSWVPGFNDQLFLVELVNDTFTSSSLVVAPSHDAAGNLTDDGLYQYAYDAWNRLVEVRRHTTDAPPGSPQRLVATYRYDGLGHRIYKKVANSGDKDREEYYYYNQKWQLLEIDDAGDRARQQFVWGINYIDEAVCMDVDTDTNPEAEGYGNCTDSGGSRHFFYMQDANWNVVALREGSSVVERYEYDSYGAVRIYRGSDSASSLEQRTVAGQSLKWLDTSLLRNPMLYCGYFHDSETGLYHVRHRMLGRDRWMQRDPRGYIDGADLYSYVGNRSTASLDPMGTVTINDCLAAGKRAKAAFSTQLQQMNLKGCKEPLIICWCCGDDRKLNQFDSVTKNIIMCADQFPNTTGMEAAIMHELVHAYDDCMGADWTDCDERACSEVRAMSSSGQCKMEGWRQSGETEEECIKRNATWSVEKDTECKDKARSYVDKMYAQCNVQSPGGVLPPWPFPDDPCGGVAYVARETHGSSIPAPVRMCHTCAN